MLLEIKKKRKRLRLITFVLLEKRAPIMILTKELNFTGIPTDMFQRNVRIVFMRVILSCCVIVDVWLKQVATSIYLRSPLD